MLFGAVTFIVVIASGDPTDGSTEALSRALRTALGDEAAVVVKSAAEVAPDDAVAKAGQEPSSVVGVVTWNEQRRHVVIRFASAERTGEREIRFDASDAPVERGRTVGFALASMVPDKLLASRRSSTPAPAPAPAPTPAPAPAASSLSRDEPAEPTAERRGAPSRNPFAIDLAAQGAVGVAGSGGGLGGAAGARVPFGRGFAARVGIGARVGEIAEARATSRVLSGSAGLAWQAWPTPSRAWSVGARIDGLLLVHTLVHFSPDDPEPVSRSRAVPGIDARVEGTVRLVEHASFLLALGPEIALGKTEVIVAGDRAATLPPVRLCLETGLRVWF